MLTYTLYPRAKCSKLLCAQHGTFLQRYVESVAVATGVEHEECCIVVIEGVVVLAGGSCGVVGLSIVNVESTGCVGVWSSCGVVEASKVVLNLHFSQLHGPI